MKITVILCTYNRCRSLARALESVAHSVLPESTSWEVLVVDNNSNDGTRELIEQYCRQYPGRFRYLFEARPGKSHALNAGVRVALGDVLAFMDDDVIVEPIWLERLTSPLRNLERAGAGGPVLLECGYAKPRWLPVEVPTALAPLALFNPDNAAGEVRQAPFGTNMAYLRRMFDKYGGFRTDLGPSPRGETLRPNEDTEFGHRLISGGEKIFYEPSAVVHHEVSENRLRKTYFLKWWFDKGRADTREFGDKPNTRLRISGVPLYLFRRALVWSLRWFFAVKPARRFLYRLRVWYIAGQIAEFHRNPLMTRQGSMSA